MVLVLVAMGVLFAFFCAAFIFISVGPSVSSRTIFSANWCLSFNVCSKSFFPPTSSQITYNKDKQNRGTLFRNSCTAGQGKAKRGSKRRTTVKLVGENTRKAAEAKGCWSVGWLVGGLGWTGRFARKGWLRLFISSQFITTQYVNAVWWIPISCFISLIH